MIRLIVYVTLAVLGFSVGAIAFVEFVAEKHVTGHELDAKIEQTIRRLRGTKDETIIPYLRCLQEENRSLMALERRELPAPFSASCQRIIDQAKPR